MQVQQPQGLLKWSHNLLHRFDFDSLLLLGCGGPDQQRDWTDSVHASFLPLCQATRCLFSVYTARRVQGGCGQW